MNHQHDCVAASNQDRSAYRLAGVNVRAASNADPDAALADARARLNTIARRCQNDKDAQLGRRLYYGQKTQLEETIHDLALNPIFDAVVTRNHYGCLVLNAAHALFIDVDMLASPRISTDYETTCRQEESLQVFDDLRTVLASECIEGFRIYRTAAGYRILATSREFTPGSFQSQRLMASVGADDAFMKLCLTQNSFRARLTPKPWRCGARRPPNSFPRSSTTEQQRFVEWRAHYDHACHDLATCQFLGNIGSTTIHDAIRPIVDFHDHQTRAFQTLALA